VLYFGLLSGSKIHFLKVEIQSALDDLDEDDFNSVMKYCFDPDANDEYETEQSSSTHPSSDLDNFLFNDNSDDSDGDDDEDDDDISSIGSADSIVYSTIVTDFKEMAGKLDSILSILMAHVKDIYTELPLADSFLFSNNFIEEFTGLLLKIFERTILKTHKCRYTQFLWFYAASLSPSFTDKFLVLLSQITMNENESSIIRISASAYLSSFVARSKFLPRKTILDVIKILNSNAVNHVEYYEHTLKNALSVTGAHMPTQGEVKSHIVFYSIVQALLYLFCFRGEDIVTSSSLTASEPRNDSGSESESDVEADEHFMAHPVQFPMEMFGFQRVVMSKFNPLKVVILLEKQVKLKLFSFRFVPNP
jgi:RNA polymerase I-specific transcription initiation factor RRN3